MNPKCTRCNARVPVRVPRFRNGRTEWLCEYCDDDDHVAAEQAARHTKRYDDGDKPPRTKEA